MTTSLPPVSAPAGPARSTEPNRDERAAVAAQDFEAVFLSTYLKSMFEGVGTDPLAAGTGSESWKELLLDEYARSFAARGGIGLAAPVAAELLKIQEDAS